MDFRKQIYRETAIMALGQALCIGITCGVFALLNQFDSKVLLGGLYGSAVVIANYFFMAVGVGLASDKAEGQNVSGGKAVIRSSYLIRTVAMAVLLFIGAKSGKFNLITMLLPLAFFRPILMFGEFFRKKGEK